MERGRSALGAGGQLPVRMRSGVVDPGAEGEKARAVGPVEIIGSPCCCNDCNKDNRQDGGSFRHRIELYTFNNKGPEDIRENGFYQLVTVSLVFCRKLIYSIYIEKANPSQGGDAKSWISMIGCADRQTAEAIFLWQFFV